MSRIRPGKHGSKMLLRQEKRAEQEGKAGSPGTVGIHESVLPAEANRP